MQIDFLSHAERCLLKNNAFFLGEIEQEDIPEFSHAPTADHRIPYSSKGVSQRQLVSGIADFLFFAKKQFSLFLIRKALYVGVSEGHTI